MILPNNEKVNQHKYLELLCDYTSDSLDDIKAEVVIKDSLCPYSYYKKCSQWMSHCEVPYIRDWPRNSPDIQ